MSGFYLMHRGWLENPVFGGPRREPFDRRSAWVWLIEHASFTTTTVLIGGKPVELKRGELSYSSRDLASRWGWSEAKVRRYCVAVASAKMISCVTDAGQMIITICNYEKYQQPGRVGDADESASVTHHRRTIDAPNKQYKEGKELEGREEDAPAEAGALPSLDVMGELISRCTVWLARTTQRTERSVRGLVVGWLKTYGDGAVVEVFTEASRSPPFEPISWIEARLKRRGEKSNGKSSAEHDRALDILRDAALDADFGPGHRGSSQAPH